jgi:hypothetical protein
MKKQSSTLFDFEEDLDTKDHEAKNIDNQEEAADPDEELPPPLPCHASLAISAPANSSSLFKTVTTQNAKKTVRTIGNGAHAIVTSESLAIKGPKDSHKESKAKAETLGLSASVFGFAFSPPTRAAESRSKGKEGLKKQISKSADSTTSSGLNK